MNPLGGEAVIVAVFGACTAIVMVLAILLRARRGAVALTVIAGATCGTAIYGAISMLALLIGGTHGYGLATWLIIVGAGAIPAGLIGLVEGFVSSVIVRQFDRNAMESRE